MPKRSIRERLLARRRHCPAEYCLQHGLLIQQRFLAGTAYRRAVTLGLYSPLHNEVETGLVAGRCLVDGKRLCYPRVNGDELEFVAVGDLADLTPGAYGILEPGSGAVLPWEEIDLLVIPGVAFDLHGHRLGYGRGYYDRALARCRPDMERVGLAYQFQVVEQLPADGHDMRMTRVVTEENELLFARDASAASHHSRRGGAEC